MSKSHEFPPAPKGHEHYDSDAYAVHHQCPEVAELEARLEQAERERNAFRDEAATHNNAALNLKLRVEKAEARLEQAGAVLSEPWAQAVGEPK